MLGYNKPNILTVAGGAYVAGLAGELAQKDVNNISMIAQDTIIIFQWQLIKYENHKRENFYILSFYISYFIFICTW